MKNETPSRICPQACCGGSALDVEIETLTHTDTPIMTQEAITARVTRDASRLYGDTIAEETLAVWASSAVAELWGDAVKVTAFLPVLALRMVSNRAESLSDLSEGGLS